MHGRITSYNVCYTKLLRTDFLELADRKKNITDEDLSILMGETTKGQDKIKLNFLQVVSGKTTIPMATVRLDVNGKIMSATESGDGPVDAAIKAIKSIINKEVILEEFLIQAITRGSDDMGKVHMQLEHKHT